MRCHAPLGIPLNCAAGLPPSSVLTMQSRGSHSVVFEYDGSRRIGVIDALLEEEQP